MLIVAPSGRTKLLILLDTPKFSCVFLIVTGKVAALLAVLKAIMAAGEIPLKNVNGRIFANTLTESEYTIIAWRTQAIATAIIIFNKGNNTCGPYSPITGATNPRIPIGANFIMIPVILNIISENASKKLYTGSAFFPNNVIANPRKIAKKIICKISPSARAVNGFSGTILRKV